MQRTTRQYMYIHKCTIKIPLEIKFHVRDKTAFLQTVRFRSKKENRFRVIIIIKREHNGDYNSHNFLVRNNKLRVKFSNQVKVLNFRLFYTNKILK